MQISAPPAQNKNESCSALIAGHSDPSLHFPQRRRWFGVFHCVKYFLYVMLFVLEAGERRATWLHISETDRHDQQIKLLSSTRVLYRAGENKY